jgi:hypothetical protein
MSTPHIRFLPMTPANLKRAKADIKQYSIDHEPIRWADGHMLLSEQYIDEVFESSGPARAADKGIEHIEETLKVYTEDMSPPRFAAAQLGLARLYPKRVAGNRKENQTKALACAKTALRVMANCPPVVVAELHDLIGSIYEDADFEPSNSRVTNEDLAIRHYLASLQRSSMCDDNDNWAHRQMKVGLIYSERKNGRRRSNFKVAIKHFVEASKVFNKAKNPINWATAHQYLALSYSNLITTADRAAILAKMSEE